MKFADRDCDGGEVRERLAAIVPVTDSLRDSMVVLVNNPKSCARYAALELEILSNVVDEGRLSMA